VEKVDINNWRFTKYLTIYQEFQAKHDNYKTPKLSYYQEKYPVTQYTKNNGLFESLSRAYQAHGGVLLRPNDLWVQVMFDFSSFINDNSESFRNVFVQHQGKIKLTAVNEKFDIDVFLADLEQQIAKNLNLKVPLVTKFESDVFDMTIQHAMAMNAFKSYFEFICETGCGVTHVEFEGSPEDWLLLQTSLIDLKRLICRDIFARL
jgi:hypothetical protein